jgi:hypothetical protein
VVASLGKIVKNISIVKVITLVIFITIVKIVTFQSCSRCSGGKIPSEAISLVVVTSWFFFWGVCGGTSPVGLFSWRCLLPTQPHGKGLGAKAERALSESREQREGGGIVPCRDGKGERVDGLSAVVLEELEAAIAPTLGHVL